MAYPFTVADVVHLIGADGRRELEAVAALSLSPGSLLADLTKARRFAGTHAAAAVETIVLRRKAFAKLGDRSGSWLLTDEALQQASPWQVAMHRARRLTASSAVHDVTCSIGTDLAALATLGGTVVGSDLDPVRLAMAAHNVPNVALVRADALTPVTTGTVIYADPARRLAGGSRRITSVDTIPSVADLDQMYADRLPVLRLPPGIDYDTLDRPGEVEIVSLDGTAREAVLWPPPFDRAGVRRRATVLSSSDASWEISDSEPACDPIAASVVPGQVIVDPDAAVVRAHLVRQYAARHDLRLVDPHLAYLVGDSAPGGLRGFRVLDVAPFTERAVREWVRRDGIGTLEIKQRGTPVIPDELRARLRKTMSSDTRVAATLVVARIGPGPVAMWCRAEARTPSP